jgi:hypothetical protein
MIKKIFLCIVILTLSNCGYEAIYSKKNVFNDEIQSFETEGDKKINRKIISSLKLKNQAENSGYKLIINSSKSLETILKDSSGRASTYNLKINVVVSLIKEEKIFKTKNFNSNFTFNNNENKFDLAQYQKDIEANLIDRIIQEIIIFLTF